MEKFKAAYSSQLSLRDFRAIVQDAHINFLLGAGTSMPFFKPLGDVELALTSLSNYKSVEPKIRKLVRASIQAYFYKGVVYPNTELVSNSLSPGATELISSYREFLRAINLLLIRRKNTLLPKQANIFTTNVDAALKVATEHEGISANTGFIGTFNPQFQTNHFGTLQIRQGDSFNYRSEVPTINIIHLHGSVTWKLGINKEIFLDANLEQVLQVEASYRDAFEANGFLQIGSDLDLDINSLVERGDRKATLLPEVDRFRSYYEKLNIINPEKTKFAKTVMDQTYYELIRKLANELERENSVLFVHGFSFRDEHFQQVILRAAATNPTVMIIIFCYNSQAKGEISKLLEGGKNKNKNIFFITPRLHKCDDDSEGIEKDQGLDLRMLTKEIFLRILPELSLVRE